MYRSVLVLVYELTALAAVTAYRVIFSANAADGFFVLAALVLCCLFLGSFLAEEMWRKRKKPPRRAAAAVPAGICVFVLLLCGASDYFPVFVPFFFTLIGRLCTREYFYGIFTVGTVLAALMARPSAYCLTVAGILFVALILSESLTERLESLQKSVEEEKREVKRLREKVDGLKAYSRTIRETAVFEERNRFSARIHDRLGHGISGSILLLEGAKRCVRTDPDRAEECIGIAAGNLRGSVDSIREALREERPLRHIAGAAELRGLLERFSVQHGVKTDFSLEGDAERIPPQIWNCLKENLIEAITNTAKHSGADRFSLRIVIYNKIIRAEFSDNGKERRLRRSDSDPAEAVRSSGKTFPGGGAVRNGNFKKGMGLTVMEERTADCGGNCIFPESGGGFRIVNVFRI